MAINSELLTRSKLTGYVAILDDELTDPDKSDLDMDNIILRKKEEDAIKDMVTRCYKTGFLQKELSRTWLPGAIKLVSSRKNSLNPKHLLLLRSPLSPKMSLKVVR